MNATRMTLAAAVALAGLASWHALAYWGTFDSAPPPEARWEAVSPAPVAAPPSQARVVIAVVDGLREDYAGELGFPAGEGARCVLDAQLPAFSRPNYVALATGAPPTLSGVRTNDYEGPARLESIFDVARGAGYRTEAVTDGNDWWSELFPEAWSATRFLDKAAFASFIASWVPAPGTLALVHIVEVDDQGHDHGVGAGYAAAARAAGAQLRALWGRLDPARDTLFVTSDHGHIDRGGHGGPEAEVIRTPLIVLGAGAAGAPHDVGCQHASLDLAATVAAVLGVRPPAASQGGPIAVVLAPAVAAAAIAPLAPPPADPGFRAVRPLPIALAVALWLGALALLIRASPRRKGEPPLWHFAVRGGAYLLAFTGVVFASEPMSFSAIWLRGPWIVHMVALTLGAAILAWALTWVLNATLRQRPARAAQWVLLFAVLPSFVAAGVHGSLFGGPQLGDARAAFALLVGDFCVLGGALTALLLLAFEAMRRVRGTSESRGRPSRPGGSGRPGRPKFPILQ